VIPFHRVLITTAIVFCAGFAFWALGQYLAFKHGDMLALTLVFALFAVGFGYYLRNLKRFLRR